jgi:hypothetical protein
MWVETEAVRVCVYVRVPVLEPVRAVGLWRWRAQAQETETDSDSETESAMAVVTEKDFVRVC